MTRLSSLTTYQIALIARLNDGPPEDSVGIEAHDLSWREMQSLDILRDKGLVQAGFGWQLSFWYRLTSAGWAVIAEAHRIVRQGRQR